MKTLILMMSAGLTALAATATSAVKTAWHMLDEMPKKVGTAAHVVDMPHRDFNLLTDAHPPMAQGQTVLMVLAKTVKTAWHSAHTTLGETGRITVAATTWPTSGTQRMARHGTEAGALMLA